MRRLPVRFRREARADLAGIYAIVQRASRDDVIAERFTRRIIARCRRIGDAPFGGRPRDDLVSGLRTVPFEGSAIIAYRVEPDCVRVTNIFYGGRDIEGFYLAQDGEFAPAKQH